VELKAGDIGKVYRVAYSGKRPAQLWGDGATSVDGWEGQRDLDVETELRFVEMKPGDWGPDEPVFEDVATGQKGYFSPSYGISDRRGVPGMPLKGWLSENRDKGKSMKITKRQLRRIIQKEYRAVLREQKEKAAKYAPIDTGTNIKNVNTADIYKQMVSGDENTPLYQAMLGATKWAPAALAKAGGAEGLKKWAESVGEAELSSRITKVGAALPETGLPKKDMPALEGEDAPKVKDALSPGGKYNVDFEAIYAGDEESVDAWMKSLSDEDQTKLAAGEEPEIKEEGFLREDKFPAPGTIKGGGDKPVGQALAFLVKGKYDGDQTDDNIDVKVNGSLPNSKMIPTQSNILAAKSLLFAFLQGVGGSDLTDMGGAFVTSAGEILDGHHRWSGAFIGTGGGLTHNNVHIVQGNKDELLPALTAIGNAIGRSQKESVQSIDQRIMERWNKLAGLL